MLSAASYQALSQALATWTDQPATFWWRDDDAVAATPALERMAAISTEYGVPLALACIPAEAEASLVESVRHWPLATVWQHGYAHVNHAPAGQKKCELGVGRDVQTIMQQLALGQAQLEAAFGERFAAVLVPPWNRISQEVKVELPRIGIRKLSTFKARKRTQSAVGIVNTHIDLIDWRGSRGFAGEMAVVGAIVAHLNERQDGTVDPAEPTGILTHHLVHDEGCWMFLDSLFRALVEHPNARLMPIDALPFYE